VTWQIVPTALGKLMNDPDREKTGRVMKALMQMNKLDIQRLQDAYRGA
jgi:predicted 3-demethylubiquinone-9 3-methyltransferase (glyoxalase superfamily)